MLHKLTIHEAAALLRAGDITAVELTGAVLDRILAVDNDIKAYLTLTPELALEQAAEADAAFAAARQRGTLAELPLLTGIPLAIKDVITVEGVPLTAGSKILEGYVPPYNATVVEKLRAAGAVILGKTNTDEFAMGSSTENSAYFTTHNPWDLSRVPGGSSGGSAAAVAADECLGAFGSDTGGSVRQPASFCGIVGVKPTYGRVSRYGLAAYASSLDQIGPFAKDVTDAAILLGAVAGHDRRDSTSVDVPVPDYLAGIRDQGSGVRSQESGVRGLRVGVPKEYFIEGIQPDVEAAVRAAIGDSARPGRRGARDQPAAHRPGAACLLSDRAGGGVGQPGALRRHPLWVVGAGGIAVGDLSPHARRGFRAGGQAPDHARRLCPQRGLL